MEQCVVHRLAAAAGAFDDDPQVGPGFGLADEFAKPLRPPRAVVFT
jgi:hypothetical protein